MDECLLIRKSTNVVLFCRVEAVSSLVQQLQSKVLIKVLFEHMHGGLQPLCYETYR